jgi:hypothetical protein
VSKAICLFFILTFCAVSAADPIPRCWQADLPSEDIQDGLFRVYITTSGASARDVATVMGILSGSLAAQTGAAPSIDLERIELDMQSYTNYWEPTAAFPTLDAYKDAVLNSMAGALRFNVTFACAKVTHHGK